MSVKTITAECLECTCERCGHVWIATPRQNASGKWVNLKPVACAKCKSAYWDRPRLVEQVQSKKKRS